MKAMCKSVFGTDEAKHPGCVEATQTKEKFLGGKVTLVQRPKINAPYDQYFIPPLEMRKPKFTEKGWKRIVAHQTRNVPHTGHEWLMKGAWLQTLRSFRLKNLLWESW